MKPLKRHENLKPLSRDHHHGLLLCWKIKEGLKKGITPERIKKYTDYFYRTQLIPHFAFEEKEVFPLLGNDHPSIKRALAEHQQLRSLFFETENLKITLETIQKELEAHIRFEERVVFAEIQQQTEEHVLNEMETKEENIETPSPDDWEDLFWVKNVQ